MKKVLFVLFLLPAFTAISYGQNKKKELISPEEIYGDTDPDFQVTEVPEKWKNESAVVLAQKVKYTYDYSGSYIRGEEIFHRRIKVLDNAAVNTFSVLYLSGSSMILKEKGAVGIRVIKPNGTKIDVNTDNPVLVSYYSEMSPLFHQFWETGSGMNKFAVPNLEIGDVIDYYVVLRKNCNYREAVGLSFLASSDLVQMSLGTSYPVLSQRLDFILGKFYKLNFNSYNGAPQLMETPTTDTKKKDDKFVKFSFTDRNREKVSEELWSRPYTYLPMVKFQVFFLAHFQEKYTSNFFNPEGALKSKVEKEEVAKSLNNIMYEMSLGFEYAYLITAHFNNTNLDKNYTVRSATAIYYYYRYVFLTKDYTGSGVTSFKRIYDLEKTPYQRVNNITFIKVMSYVLDQFKINYEIIAVPDKDKCSIDNVLQFEELNLGIRVGGAYFFPFDSYNTDDVNNYNIDGADAYAYEKSNKTKEPKIERITLPSSTAEDNSISQMSLVTINENMEQVKVSREMKISGMFKPQYSPVVLFAHDYLLEEEKKQNPEYVDEAPGVSKAKREEEKRQRDANTEERRKEQLVKMKELASKDYDVASYDNFELTNSGRFPESPDLTYKESLQVKNLLNKAGKNYLLDVGKLIGDQVKIEEKDMKRESDVYLPFAKSLTNEITIELPAGYTVENINDLNFNVDNAYGKFKSTATLSGNKLVIKTEKSYKQSHVKKEDWPQMVAFLEAAYKFSQKKAVLKKA